MINFAKAFCFVVCAIFSMAIFFCAVCAIVPVLSIIAGIRI